MDSENGESQEKKVEEPLRVVSEVNTFLVVASDVNPLSKPSNRIARLQFAIPQNFKNHKLVYTVSPKTPTVDEDGDLVVRRKKDVTNVDEAALLIEYENSTTLAAVGLQVWRGAFLLADFILENVSKFFQDKIVLELGSGTGLTSIIAAMYAKKVIATDLDEHNILDLIRCNVKHNEKFINSEFHILPLDFTNLTWPRELEEFVASADVILAADVVYHERITEAFVLTLKKILSSGNKSKDVFIAMEKRYVFTISDLDTVAPMYAHFLDMLESVLNLSTTSSEVPVVLPGCGSTSFSSQTRLSIQEIPLNFQQYFNYEKTKELVLWHLSSSVTQKSQS